MSREFVFASDRESTVEDTVVAWAENNGWVARLMKYRGRNGCPDVFFFGYGHIVPIEFKRPGGKRSAGQVSEHRRLAAVGVHVGTFSTSEDAISHLKNFMP